MWKVFHESALPHVVLVPNGGDFSHKQGVTHFSATKDIEQSWKCVSADLNVGERGKWSGYKRGLAYAMDKFHEKEKFKLLDTTRNMSANIQQLCQDWNNLCIRRDQVCNEIAHMHISVDKFKCFDTYYYKAHDIESVHKKEHKKKQDKEKKLKKSTRSCGKFPDDL